MFKLPKLLFEKPESETGNLDVALPGDELEADLDLLDDDKDDEENKDNKKEKEDDEELEEENKEEENEDDEEDKDDNEEDDEEGKKKGKKDEEADEEIELAKHSYSDIKKKYPNLFKEFPGLKTAFFREQEFSRYFPTLDDAKEAVRIQANFEAVRDTVMSGDAESFLKNLKSASEDAVGNFAGNFLDGLAKVDKDTYLEVTSPVIQNTLSQLYKLGVSKRDKNIANASIIAYQEIFGGELEEIPALLGKKLVKEEKKVNPEREALKKEEQELLNEKALSIRGEVWGQVEKELTREIEKGLDPTNSIRPGLKKLIVDKIFAQVIEAVSKDETHVKRMDEIWERERKTRYKGTYKDSLKNTYLSRAKALVPNIRQKVRTEIVGAQKKQDSEKKETLNKNNKQKLDVGGPAGKGTKDTKIKAGMTDLEFLNS